MILSNYRRNSYKTSRNHNIFPKKKLIEPTSFNNIKKNGKPSQLAILVSLLGNVKPLAQPLAKPLAKPLAQPLAKPLVQPLASASIMQTHVIYIYNMAYHIVIPEGFNIYEGLCIWYPRLYEAVIEEENQLIVQDILEEEEDEDNAKWDNYDYLEYLCD